MGASSFWASRGEQEGIGQFPQHLFFSSLHKVLFTEQPETYYKWDNWPPESDRK